MIKPTNPRFHSSGTPTANGRLSSEALLRSLKDVLKANKEVLPGAYGSAVDHRWEVG
jgi:hypothetical protein